MISLAALSQVRAVPATLPSINSSSKRRVMETSFLLVWFCLYNLDEFSIIITLESGGGQLIVNSPLIREIVGSRPAVALQSNPPPPLAGDRRTASKDGDYQPARLGALYCTSHSVDSE